MSEGAVIPVQLTAASRRLLRTFLENYSRNGISIDSWGVGGRDCVVTVQYLVPRDQPLNRGAEGQLKRDIRFFLRPLVLKCSLICIRLSRPSTFS